MLTSQEIVVDVLHDEFDGITLNQILKKGFQNWLWFDSMSITPISTTDNGGVDYLIEVVNLRNIQKDGEPWFTITGAIPIHKDDDVIVYWGFGKTPQYGNNDPKLKYWDKNQDSKLKILIGLDEDFRYETNEWEIDGRPESTTVIKLAMEAMARRVISNASMYTTQFG